MSKLKVYVGCSLAKATEKFKDDVTALKSVLSKEYEVIEFLGQSVGSNSDVYKHDMNCIENADFVIAVCDEPSTGLGVELERARALGKPTLLVAQKNSQVSRLIIGMSENETSMTLVRYETLVFDLPNMVDLFVVNSLK